MSKVASLKAAHDEAFADLTLYLEGAEADLTVAEEKETAYKSAKTALEQALAIENRVAGYANEISAKSTVSPNRPIFAVHTDRKSEVANSLGRAIVESNAFKSFSGSVEIPAEFKTTLNSAGLTGFDRPPGIVTIGVQQPVVADLIPQANTDQPTVRLFVENTFTNSAGMTSESGQKPEGVIDLTERDFPVRKIAVLQPVTDEMLADHPAVMGYLNQRLPYALAIKEEGQILLGDGTGANLTGIMNTSGISTYAKGTVTGDSNGDAIRKAVAKVQALGFFAPDGMVAHPLDWDILAREKDLNGQYFGGGPFTGAYGVNGVASVLPRYWGLNVVVTTSIPQGTVLVGSFANGAQIFRRMGVTVEMSASHGNTFALNIKTIRVEERLALAVTQPKSFATVTSIG